MFIPRHDANLSHRLLDFENWQPQLWLRGGCRGKIRRAEKKLIKARDDDLPTRISATQACQTDLPELFSAVEEHGFQFEISANAASEREAMKARAVLENPSSALVRLQHEESTIERRVSRYTKECEVLDEIIVQLVHGQEQYLRVTRVLEESISHRQQYNELRNHQAVMAKPMAILQASHLHESYAETWMPNGTKSVMVQVKKDHHKHLFLLDKHNRVLMTNFPCPGGCGYLVTWHSSHCCGACSDGTCQHGQRCQKKPLNCQDGARAKLTHWNQQRIAYAKVLSAEDDASRRKLSMAREESKGAYRMCAQQLDRIPFTIRERYPAFCGPLASENCVFPNTVHGGCGCSQEVASIEGEIQMTKRAHSVLTEQLSSAEHIRTRVKDETAEIEEKLLCVQSLGEQEHKNIFDQLRIQVLLNESPSLPPPTNPAFVDEMSQPSAPSEEQVLASDLESNELSHEFGVARQIEPVQAEEIIIVSSPESEGQENSNIPIARATLVASGSACYG